MPLADIIWIILIGLICGAIAELLVKKFYKKRKA